MKLENLYWPATVVWAAVIFYQSIAQVTAAQKVGITASWFPYFEHFAAYAVLCGLLFLSLNYSKIKQPILHAFMFAVIYGAAMELVQGFFAYRAPSFTDAFVNTVGAFASAAILEAKEKKWI